VQKLVSNGSVLASEPSPEKKNDPQMPPRRYVPQSNEKPNSIMAGEKTLVVLNEANEPEEEEDSLEDIIKSRQQRLAALKARETVVPDKMTVKRRLQKAPNHRSPELKIQAINALYGTDYTLESIKKKARARQSESSEISDAPTPKNE